MKRKGNRSAYFTSVMQNHDVEAYLLLLKEIVKNTRNRDMDHHEYYDETVEEQEIDSEPIRKIEEKLEDLPLPN